MVPDSVYFILKFLRDIKLKIERDTLHNKYMYLLLTEFEVRTVSYGPRFFR